MSDASTVHRADSALSREARIRAVVDAVVRRRMNDAGPAHDDVVREFAELMPELGERLAALRRVEAGRDRHVGVEPSASDETLAAPARAFDLTLTLASAHLDSGAEPTAPRADLVPGYQITREISRGGQGVVYEAMQAGTQRRVAIKILHPVSSESQSARRRFEREVELVAGLRHPHIVPIFHIVRTSDGRDGYVMDFVDGLTLKAFARRRQLGLAAALRLFAEVCAAVQFAHQNGVVHRDLKPTNILVDEAGEPHLLDFGLARTVQPEDGVLVTASGEIVGTLPYMSPEQTRGGAEAIDTRSDVYALGVILYELLTGRYPYAMDRPLLDALRSIAESPPTPLSEAWIPEAGVAPGTAHEPASGAVARSVVSAGRALLQIASWVRGSRAATACPIDDEIQTIVDKALSKNRERRYQSAGELGRDVGRYLAGEAIEAKRDSLLYVLRKHIRRHGVAIATAFGVALILLSAGLYAFDSYMQRRADARLKVKLDQALQRESRHYQKIEATARQWQLGWFLLEWRADRIELAREIGGLLAAPAAPERAIVEFLLDPRMTLDALTQRLPAEQLNLAYLAAGERALKAGDRAGAAGMFRAGAALGGRNWWSAVLEDRIRQLTESGDSTDSLGEGRP